MRTFPKKESDCMVKYSQAVREVKIVVIIRQGIRQGSTQNPLQVRKKI